MLLVILKSFILICILSLTAVMYLFAGYAWINRKDLKLGHSEMPATKLDMVIITVLPIALTCVSYLLCGLMVTT
jgi:hypothetical protein